MSADCLFVLRHSTNLDLLRNIISNTVHRAGLGVWFTPNNGLLSCGQLVLETDTFLFEPTDAPGTIGSGLLLSPDYYSINGRKAMVPFSERAKLIQDLAQVSLLFADSLEIYISEDNPYLPDFCMREIRQDQVKNCLLCEYSKEERHFEPIPCICMRVTK